MIGIPAVCITRCHEGINRGQIGVIIPWPLNESPGQGYLVWFHPDGNEHGYPINRSDLQVL